ncbi:MAG: hypothetical protein ISF22_07160 [Methanomassiliicoccus sp.]|nr:hypothetical protein [Methanomassiliicoccus sp.]
MAIDPRYENPVSVLGRSALRRSWNIAGKYVKVPGVRALVRQERCTGCGACVRKGFCRFGAIRIEEGRAVVDEQGCRGCTRCTHLCPKDALTLEVRAPGAVRDTLRALDKEISRHL